MFGYNVPVENLSAFLAAWPCYEAEARKGYAGWLKKFTNMSVPGLTALAMLSVAQRKAADATPLLERAAAVDPAAVGPSLFLAAHYRSLGEDAKALYRMEHPHVVDLWGTAGRMLARKASPLVLAARSCAGIRTNLPRFLSCSGHCNRRLWGAAFSIT